MTAPKDRTRGAASSATPSRSWPAFLVRARVWTVLILGVALIGGASLRLLAINGKRVIQRDEGISYLAATGHQGSYARMVRDRASPYGTWVPVAEWKRFFRAERNFCLATISRDLAGNDKHPPLYFWFLHIGVLALGVEVWSGPLINVPIAFLSTLALFGLARCVLRNSVLAAVVALLWSFSPTVIPSALEARPYELLALCTILLVWQVIALRDRSGPIGRGRYVLLAATAAAGMLTHFHFAPVVVGCLVFLLLCPRSERGHRRRDLSVCLVIGLGCLALPALFPRCYNVIRRGTSGRQALMPDGRELGYRIDTVLARYAGFFHDYADVRTARNGKVTNVIMVGVGCLLLTILVHSWLARRRDATIWLTTHLGDLQILYFLLWTAATNIFLYLMFISPRHAMQAKYPCTVWPFLAFVPVLFARRTGRLGVVFLIGVAGWVMFDGVQYVGGYRELHRTLWNPQPLLATVERIVVDDVRRDIFPRIIWHLPDEAMILAADPNYLLKHPEEVGVVRSNALYLSDWTRRRWAQPSIANVWSPRYRREVVRQPLWGSTRAELLQEVGGRH